MQNDEILESLKKSEKREDKLQSLGYMIENINNVIKTGGDLFIVELIRLLNDSDDFVRIKATEAAEYCKDEIIVENLIDKMLNDNNYFVRGFAAKALGSIGNMKAHESLEKATNDPEGFVVSFAQQSLKTINIKLSFSSKLDLLKQKMKENVNK